MRVVSPTYPTASDRLLRVQDVASILGVTPRTVIQMAHDGRLPRVVLGRRITRYRRADVEALITAHVSVNDERPAGGEAFEKGERDGARHTP